MVFEESFDLHFVFFNSYAACRVDQGAVLFHVVCAVVEHLPLDSGHSVY